MALSTNPPPPPPHTHTHTHTHTPPAALVFVLILSMTVATPKSPGGKEKGGREREKERGGRGEETVKGKRGRREGGEGGVNLPTIIEWSSLRKMLLGFMSL